MVCELKKLGRKGLTTKTIVVLVLVFTIVFVAPMFVKRTYTMTRRVLGEWNVIDYNPSGAKTDPNAVNIAGGSQKFWFGSCVDFGPRSTPIKYEEADGKLDIRFDKDLIDFDATIYVQNKNDNPPGEDATKAFTLSRKDESPKTVSVQLPQPNSKPNGLEGKKLEKEYFVIIKINTEKEIGASGEKMNPQHACIKFMVRK